MDDVRWKKKRVIFWGRFLAESGSAQLVRFGEGGFMMTFLQYGLVLHKKTIRKKKSIDGDFAIRGMGVLCTSGMHRTKNS